LFEGKGNLGPSKFQPVASISDTPAEDITLRFFDNCPYYTNRVLNNQSMSFDSLTYIGKYSPNILQKVIQKLQIQGTWNLTVDDVSVFYRICAFEIALFENTNQFCKLFTVDDIYRYETSNDLSDYWIKGYGNAINYRISCPLLTDFWNSITAALQGSTQRSKLRFAHAETILPFAALLGLYKDNFVLHWNSPQIDNRLWKTSQITPFAANIAMVLYNCSGIPKVKLLYNEIETPIPGCGGQMYCPVSQLATIWKNYLTVNCNFNALCGIAPSHNLDTNN